MAQETLSPITESHLDTPFRIKPDLKTITPDKVGNKYTSVPIEFGSKKIAEAFFFGTYHSIDRPTETPAGSIPLDGAEMRNGQVHFSLESAPFRFSVIPSLPNPEYEVLFTVNDKRYLGVFDEERGLFDSWIGVSDEPGEQGVLLQPELPQYAVDLLNNWNSTYEGNGKLPEPKELYFGPQQQEIFETATIEFRTSK